MKKFKEIILLFIVIIATSCDTASDNTNQEQAENFSPEFIVTGVNDYDFLFNDTDAGGAVIFKSSEFDPCRISFIKSKFTHGYSVHSSALGKGDIDLTCLGEKDHFALNNSDTTFVEMSVKVLADKAVVTLNFSLFGIKSKTNLTREKVQLDLPNNLLNGLLGH